MQDILTLPFVKAGQNGVELFGGKALSLVRLFHAGINVPPGFVITTAAAHKFLNENKIDSMISSWLDDHQKCELSHMERFAVQIQEVIVNGRMPDLLDQAIRSSYGELICSTEQSQMVVARSSGMLEDSSGSSFAGQYSSSLGLKDLEDLYAGIKKCWASAFSKRVIRYRLAQNFSMPDHLIGVVVQEMVPGEIAGILFTAHPITWSKDVAVIEASWGLGDPVVSGRVTPDHIELSVKDHTYLTRRIGTKKMQLVLNGERLDFVEVPQSLREALCLSDTAVWELVSIGKKIERILGCPVDVEWVMRKGQLYVVQARPITGRHQDS